jgi:hypothetical protein
MPPLRRICRRTAPPARKRCGRQRRCPRRPFLRRRPLGMANLGAQASGSPQTKSSRGQRCFLGRALTRHRPTTPRVPFLMSRRRSVCRWGTSRARSARARISTWMMARDRKRLLKRRARSLPPCSGLPRRQPPPVVQRRRRPQHHRRRQSPPVIQRPRRHPVIHRRQGKLRLRHQRPLRPSLV